MKSGSNSRLIVDSVSNIGPHYARTLREWRHRFNGSFDGPIVDALKDEHPELLRGSKGAAEIEVFRRKWLYYFCYCEAGFLMRVLGVHIITFAREGYESFGCSTYE
ncbi:hypothetical protein FRC02_000715 [Tulasnella sp. 418]|nr:hypothetical protein FRC02_000715 [Tulasnella sp. 418]